MRAKLIVGVLLVLVVAGVAGGLWSKARRAQARGVARITAITQSRAAFEPLIQCVVGEPLEPEPELGTRLQALIAERHEKLMGGMATALEGCAGQAARLRAPLAVGDEGPLGDLQAAARSVETSLAALIAAVRVEASRDEVDAKLANEQANSGDALAAARCALGASATEPVDALATALVDRCFKSDPIPLVDTLARSCADKLDTPVSAGGIQARLPLQPRVRQGLRHCLREARRRRTAPARRHFADRVERYLEASRRELPRELSR